MRAPVAAAILTCAMLTFAAPALAQGAGAPVPVETRSKPIERFDADTPVGSRFGELTFLGGLEISSDDPDFGGLSGLRVEAGGKRFTAVSDRGNWFRGAIDYDGTNPIALSDVTRVGTPGRDGKPLAGRRGFDTEALEIDGRTAWVSAERVHWLTRYQLDADGRPNGPGKAVALPKAAGAAPSNSGYEAMARLASGEIAMIAENLPNQTGDDTAFVVGGRAPFTFSVKRADDFSPTDLVRLPDGDLVMLERRYKPPFSLSIRIKRLAAREIAPGATVDGQVLLEASLFRQQIDNFEAIAAHPGADGATVLTILSDDNFSARQRTLLMQFRLAR